MHPLATICYYLYMKLQHYLERYNITQTKFADMAGISHQTVNYWISGKRMPRMAHLQLISTLTAGKVQPNDWCV